KPFFLIVSHFPYFASPEMADDLANLCRFLFDETGLTSSTSSSDLFSQRIRSDDSIKRGLRYFYILLRSGIAPIGADGDSSSVKLRFETWSDSQLQALVSISQAILLLGPSGTDSSGCYPGGDGVLSQLLGEVQLYSK
ncbi:hypothetical protein HID58_020275, partial [Brassica napus]